VPPSPKEREGRQRGDHPYDDGRDQEHEPYRTTFRLTVARAPKAVTTVTRLRYSLGCERSARCQPHLLIRAH
jgi:hypothetical protein